MSEEWEIWYYNFVYTIMPEDMADEYWRVRDILKDFQRLDDLNDDRGQEGLV